jgi:hypothetical protein
MTRPALVISAPSGHGPPRVMRAARSINTVVLPTSPWPANSDSDLAGNRFSHSHSVFRMGMSEAQRHLAGLGALAAALATAPLKASVLDAGCALDPGSFCW